MVELFVRFLLGVVGVVDVVDTKPGCKDCLSWIPGRSEVVMLVVLVLTMMLVVAAGKLLELLDLTRKVLAVARVHQLGTQGGAVFRKVVREQVAGVVQSRHEPSPSRGVCMPVADSMSLVRLDTIDIEASTAVGITAAKCSLAGLAAAVGMNILQDKQFFGAIP